MGAGTTIDVRADGQPHVGKSPSDCDKIVASFFKENSKDNNHRKIRACLEQPLKIVFLFICENKKTIYLIIFKSNFQKIFFEIVTHKKKG